MQNTLNHNQVLVFLHFLHVPIINLYIIDKQIFWHNYCHRILQNEQN